MSYRIASARRRAIEFMRTPLGQEATQGQYYTEMFNHAFAEIMRGNYPDSIPTDALQRMKWIGEYRQMVTSHRPKPKVEEPTENTVLDIEADRQCAQKLT